MVPKVMTVRSEYIALENADNTTAELQKPGLSDSSPQLDHSEYSANGKYLPTNELL